MRPAGITIRKLTLLVDALTVALNKVVADVERRALYLEAQRPSGTVTVPGDPLLKDLTSRRFRIETALDELQPALLGLTRVYTRGWFELPPETVVDHVTQGPSDDA